VCVCVCVSIYIYIYIYITFGNKGMNEGKKLPYLVLEFF
jgi:hypothetical protein